MISHCQIFSRILSSVTKINDIKNLGVVLSGTSMRARVCRFCAGDGLNRVVDILRKAGYEVSVEGCIGLCAKYDCGRINVIAEETEISAADFEELLAYVGPFETDDKGNRRGSFQ